MRIPICATKFLYLSLFQNQIQIRFKKRKMTMKYAEKLQDVINDLQGKVPELHLQSIAARIACAEEKAESMEHALTQVKQLAERDSEHFGSARKDIVERADETLKKVMVI